MQPYPSENIDLNAINPAAESDEPLKSVIPGIILSLLIVGIAIGITFITTGGVSKISLIILCLTTFSVGFSFVPQVNKMPHTFLAGDYFLLMFCFAIGLIADLETILAEGATYLKFAGIAMGITLLFHFITSIAFKIDRDTTLIVSTAAIYGPPFVGQVASTLNNKQIALPGITIGLLGYAVGNYLGISLAAILR